MPTNITCTAGDILANCVPIVKDAKSPRSPSSVVLTSRESLLDEIVRNAQGMGIDTLGFSSKDEVEAGVRRRDFAYRKQSKSRDSLRSNSSSSSSLSAQVRRPTEAPPQPPANRTVMKASKSEGDLLAATHPVSLTMVSPVDTKEAMLEIEYAVIDNKSVLDSGVGVARQQSVCTSGSPLQSSGNESNVTSSKTVAASSSNATHADTNSDRRSAETSSQALARAESTMSR